MAVLMILLLGPRAAMPADRPIRIAFVDTGNTGRSVTAEALAGGVITTEQLNARIISRATDCNP
jgi:protein-tyrosine phosphatase